MSFVRSFLIVSLRGFLRFSMPLNATLLDRFGKDINVICADGFEPRRLYPIA